MQREAGGGIFSALKLCNKVSLQTHFRGWKPFWILAGVCLQILYYFAIKHIAELFKYNPAEKQTFPAVICSSSV